MKSLYVWGGLCSLVACFFFSIQDGLIKLLSSEFSLIQLLLVRSVVMIPILGFVCVFRWGKKGLNTSRPGGHLLRAFFNLTAFLSYYYAISRMPLIDAVSIAASYPLILAIMSSFFLGEKPSVMQLIAILLGLIGVLFIIQPSGDAVDWIGAGAAIFGCINFAALGIFTRHLSKTESTEMMLLTGATLMMLFSLLCIPWAWLKPTHSELLLMLGISFVAGFGQYALTNAFRFAPAYIVGSLEYTHLIWAAIWGFLFFSEIPKIWVICGAVLVVISGLTVVLTEKKSAAISKP